MRSINARTTYLGKELQRIRSSRCKHGKRMIVFTLRSQECCSQTPGQSPVAILNSTFDDATGHAQKRPGIFRYAETELLGDLLE